MSGAVCDFEEFELAEYLRYREAARERAGAVPRGVPRPVRAEGPVAGAVAVEA